MEVLAVLPNFAPPILLIVAVLSTLGPGAEGVWGVVLVHSLMNVGLVSVFLKHSLQRKVSAWAQLAFLEGAERWRFWWGAGLSGVRRKLFYSFLFVFALCFTSFSVPMALGASSYSLETYIFELLRVDSQPAAYAEG